MQQLIQVSREPIRLGVPTTQLLFIFFLMTAFNQLWGLELRCTGELVLYFCLRYGKNAVPRRCLRFSLQKGFNFVP